MDNYNLQLAAACANGRIKEVIYLVEKKNADVNYICAGDADGWTPFLCACASGSFETVKYLYEHGANVHILTNEYCNGLHYASQHNNLDILFYLRKIGLDPCHLNKHNVSPLHCAKTNLKNVEFLITQGADVFSAPGKPGFKSICDDMINNLKLKNAVNKGLDYIEKQQNIRKILYNKIPTVLIDIIVKFLPIII